MTGRLPIQHNRTDTAQRNQNQNACHGLNIELRIKNPFKI